MTIQSPTDQGQEQGSVALPQNAIGIFQRLWQLIPVTNSQRVSSQENLPKTTPARRRASISDKSLDRDEHLAEKVLSQPDVPLPSEKTVFYLAYGSNLCAKTFIGRRGIRPLSAINVVVPDLRLTFDLPGLPYIEPCFAGTRFRKVAHEETETDETEDNETDESENASLIQQDHNNGALVGVVYEVTLSDYARIIATEGGGRGYKDVVVDCYPFPKSYDPADPVPERPDTEPFKAHTLLSPFDEHAMANLKRRSIFSKYIPARPNPGYAQPSARYRNLLTTGAAEHNLPICYQKRLSEIKTYRITSTRQAIGKVIFIISWAPPLLACLTLSRLLAGPDGRSPEWLMDLVDLVTSAMWSSYDNAFAKIFGDGERTV